MDAIIQRTLNAPSFTPPVPIFMKFHKENAAIPRRVQANLKAVLPLKLSEPWPQPSSLSPPSGEEVCRKHRRACHLAQASWASYLEKDRKHQDPYSSDSFDRYTSFLSTGLQPLLPYLFGQPSSAGVSLHYRLPISRPAWQIPQIVKRHYVRAVDYQTYPLASHLTRYDDTVMSYINKMVEKDKSQMKVALL